MTATTAFPTIFRVRQTFDMPRVDDVPGEVAAQLAQLRLDHQIRPGQTVAISAGSRGVANIHVILRAIVQHLQALGAAPFIVPAMGSHGGATAEGQRAVLARYGITEDFCGCPIRASMETVIVCRAAEGFPVHFDRQASAADHVVVCARVKPHTSFVGEIESGLMKMLLIGLGKHNGAQIYHRAIKDYSFGQIVRSVAREVLAQCRIIAGVAMVENAYDQTAWIEAVRPEKFEQREKELLRLAKQWLPRLPFAAADLLLIDEIGKEISGTGLDTNVVGRKFGVHEAAPDESPKIRQIAIRSLTAETHGNATGLGLVEYCRTQILRQRDDAVTRLNCLTGGHAIAAMTPLDYETDREILVTALGQIGLTDATNAKLMWIRNTLDLAEVECSTAYLNEARERPDLEVIHEPRPLPLDRAGNLPDNISLLHPAVAFAIQ